MQYLQAQKQLDPAMHATSGIRSQLDDQGLIVAGEHFEYTCKKQSMQSNMCRLDDYKSDQNEGEEIEILNSRSASSDSDYEFERRAPAGRGHK